MSTKERGDQEAVDVSFTDRISGPHWAEEQYGAVYSFFKCEACGAESVNRADLRGCCQ